MQVIAVSAAPFSGDDALAKALTESLGYRFVEPQAVVERAAAWGIRHGQLWAALSEPLRFRERLLRTRSTRLLLLRAALAEEVRTGGAVCHGSLGELLPGGAPFVLRIRVQESSETRIQAVRARLNLSRAEALNYLRRLDRERKTWLRFVYGLGPREALLHDILIDLERMDVAEACEMVNQMVRSGLNLETGRSHLARLEDFALSCRVRAALALAAPTAHLDLNVSAENGVVAIDGMTPRPEDASEIQRIASSVPGVAAVTVNGDWVHCRERLPTTLSPQPEAQALQQWRPFRHAWVAMGLAFCLTIMYSWFLTRLGSGGWQLPASLAGSRTFTGVITDTICGAKPRMDAQCVRACVKAGRGAKYAFFDGKEVYTLSDQLTPDRYASQQVRITGVLDTQARSLTVESIQPAL